MKNRKFRTAHYDLKLFNDFTYWSVDADTFLKQNQGRGGIANTIIKTTEELFEYKQYSFYEGDIVHIQYETSSWGRKFKHNFKGVVTLGLFETTEEAGCYDVVYGWYIESKEGIRTVSLMEHIGEAKIIGNIHENPELIESEA